MQSVVPSLRRLTGLTRRLANDTRGAILLFSAILLIFVLGTGGLILDFARVWNAQSELQSFADHAALVAAGELDGNPGAIARANDALDRLITDRQHYANEAVGLDSGSVTARFLRDLPANDTDNNLAPFVTANDALARFVHVQLNPYTVSTIFADILLTISGNAGVDIGVGATAVAGYTQFVCDITPMMFCTPGPNYAPVPGRMINMVSGNSGGPAQFGLLDLNFDPNGPCGAPNQGADFFRCALGASAGRHPVLRAPWCRHPARAHHRCRLVRLQYALRPVSHEPAEQIEQPGLRAGTQRDQGRGAARRQCLQQQHRPVARHDRPAAGCLLRQRRNLRRIALR
jgi:Flp pilus assembly protein TadG